MREERPDHRNAIIETVMCRLFGMSGAPDRVSATFWLLGASDSLTDQSHRDPDGTGLGWYGEDGQARVSKQTLAAYDDPTFAREAAHVESETFIAHIRYASTGGLTPRNTHPFKQGNRLFAHNGVIEGLDQLDTELGEARKLVIGDTDSERYFALITKHIDDGADPGEAIVTAARWIAANLPVYALNCILITDQELWALRYPDTHGLVVLDRRPGGTSGAGRSSGAEPLDHHGNPRELHVRADGFQTRPVVVVASEPMDDDLGWRALGSGELLHVGPDRAVTVESRLTEPPQHLLTLQELDPKAAASQQQTSGQ